MIGRQTEIEEGGNRRARVEIRVGICKDNATGCFSSVLGWGICNDLRPTTGAKGSRSALKKPYNSCSRSLRLAAGNSMSKDQKTAVNNLYWGIAMISFWMGFGICDWRHNGKEKKEKKGEKLDQ